MRGYLGTIGIALLLSTGVAAAGPHGDGGAVVRDHRSAAGGGNTVVRDHRGAVGGGAVVRDHRGAVGGGAVVRDHRSYAGRTVVRDHRGPVHITGGRYVFPGGVVRTYRAPVIRTHYYSYYHRPALIVETIEPVPGYFWMRGNWRWNGVEWLWLPGYWAVATAPVGVSVGASVVVH
ncbi:MAG: hypothetical protein E6J90_41095 [Deltaproteobacteria bacterium]|nr:MAG: hypothetical protein E6J90_41095 [Deltaproteobacteria bacterium]TMQ22452.1 MAG: hypothetical protein E6J91_01260 [Deltaproteobacteria bacterium]